MSFLVDGETRVMVQGGTDDLWRAQTRAMQNYGTTIVAAVVPGAKDRGAEGVPVFANVSEAVLSAGSIGACVTCVPAPFVRAAVEEAALALVPLIVVIAGGVPLHDQMHLRHLTRSRNVWMMGPDSPGILVPSQTSLGTIPSAYTSPGNVAVISRSGTLAFEVVKTLTDHGIGQSVCVAIGGARMIGRDFADYLRLAQADPATAAIVMVGEIGGDAEERTAAVIAREITKPVVGLLVGRHAPGSRRIGRAGAMISGTTGTIESKEQALTAAGVRLVRYLWDLPGAIRDLAGC
jgi:succinyl-CoA synthetase alpha subunit